MSTVIQNRGKMAVSILSGLSFFVVNRGLGKPLKTRFFNRSKTRTFQRAGVFGLPVEKEKAFLMAVVGIKKEAVYFFRMLAPYWCMCSAKIIKTRKRAKTFFGAKPPYWWCVKKTGQKLTFLFPLKKICMI